MGSYQHRLAHKWRTTRSPDNRCQPIAVPKPSQRVSRLCRDAICRTSDLVSPVRNTPNTCPQRAPPMGNSNRPRFTQNKKLLAKLKQSFSHNLFSFCEKLFLVSRENIISFAIILFEFLREGFLFLNKLCCFPLLFFVFLCFLLFLPPGRRGALTHGDGELERPKT